MLKNEIRKQLERKYKVYYQTLLSENMVMGPLW